MNKDNYPGYSQSRSIPSKPKERRRSMVESTKRVLLTGSAAMVEYLPEPAFQPPTDRMALKWEYLNKRKVSV